MARNEYNNLFVENIRFSQLSKKKKNDIFELLCKAPSKDLEYKRENENEVMVTYVVSMDNKKRISRPSKMNHTPLSKFVNDREKKTVTSLIKPTSTGDISIRISKNPKKSKKKKRKGKLWTLKLIDSIYNARYKAFPSELKSTEGHFESFSSFVFSHIFSRFGLRSLVKQTTHDLLENVKSLAKKDSSIELFGLFLTPYYPTRDLLFFLRARQIAIDDIYSNEKVETTVRRTVSEMKIPHGRIRGITKRVLRGQPSSFKRSCFEALGNRRHYVSVRRKRKIIFSMAMTKYLKILLSQYKKYLKNGKYYTIIASNVEYFIRIRDKSLLRYVILRKVKGKKSKILESERVKGGFLYNDFPGSEKEKMNYSVSDINPDAFFEENMSYTFGNAMAENSEKKKKKNYGFKKGDSGNEEEESKIVIDGKRYTLNKKLFVKEEEEEEGIGEFQLDENISLKKGLKLDNNNENEQLGYEYGEGVFSPQEIKEIRKIVEKNEDEEEDDEEEGELLVYEEEEDDDEEEEQMREEKIKRIMNEEKIPIHKKKNNFVKNPTNTTTTSKLELEKKGKVEEDEIQSLLKSLEKKQIAEVRKENEIAEVRKGNSEVDSVTHLLKGENEEIERIMNRSNSQLLRSPIVENEKKLLAKARAKNYKSFIARELSEIDEGEVRINSFHFLDDDLNTINHDDIDDDEIEENTSVVPEEEVQEDEEVGEEEEKKKFEHVRPKNPKSFEKKSGKKIMEGELRDLLTYDVDAFVETMKNNDGKADEMVSDEVLLKNEIMKNLNFSKFDEPTE